MHLHQVRFQPEPGLTGTGAADDQHIFVSGGFGVFGAAVHGQALRLGQDYIVLEHRVNVRCDILLVAPPGAAVFHILPEFPGILAFDVNSQPQGSSTAQTHKKISRMEAGQWRLERSGKSIHDMQQLLGKTGASSQTICLSQLGRIQTNEQIR